MKSTVLAFALCLMADAAVAHAQVDPRTVQAKKACASGKTEQGIDLLAEYFAETGDTMAIHNQARCYMQNDMPERALARFKEFLRKEKKMTGERRQETEAHIAELEAELQRKQAAARAQPAVGAQAVPQPSAPPPYGPAPVMPGQMMPGQPMAPPGQWPPPTLTTSPRPARGGGAGKVAGIVLGVVALGSAGTGVFFSTRVNTLREEVENAGKGTVPASYDSIQSKLEAGQTAQTLQWVGYGAALATGLGAILFLGLSGPGEGTAVALTPVVGPGVGGGSLNLSF